MNVQGFYRAFEDRHRGSWQTIHDRLATYRPLLRALRQTFPDTTCRGLDLGCGRGEWLQVLADEGFAAQGVDLDAGMLAEAIERMLPVEQADALTWLSAQPSSSASLISAFHLVEHLPFEQLLALLEQAHRVLQPGGLLLLETPNPENIVVGSSQFYTDPTHQRPLPPALLRFVPEYLGFAHTVVWGMNTAPGLLDMEDPGLLGVLGGVSPDYAVLALKAAPAGHTEALTSLLDRPQGISLQSLAERHAQAETRHLGQALGQLNDRIQHDLQAARTATETRFAELAQQDAHLARQIDALNTRLTQQIDDLHMRLQQHTAHTQAILAQLEAVYASYSWRITAPLRALTARIIPLLGRARPAMDRLTLAALEHLNRHPRLVQGLLRILRAVRVERLVLSWTEATRQRSQPASPDTASASSISPIGHHAQSMLQSIQQHAATPRETP